MWGNPHGPEKTGRSSDTGLRPPSELVAVLGETQVLNHRPKVDLEQAPPCRHDPAVSSALSQALGAGFSHFPAPQREGPGAEPEGRARGVAAGAQLLAPLPVWASLSFLICKMATIITTLQAKVLTLSEPFINVCSPYGYKLNKLDFPDPFTYPSASAPRPPGPSCSCPCPCPGLRVTPPLPGSS